MNTELVSQLHPARLPEAFTHLLASDLLAAFGLGMLLAAMILLLFAPLVRRRPLRPGLSARIHAAQQLPQEERLLALARLLAEERGMALAEPDRLALYRGDAVDTDSIARQIRGARR